MSRTNHLRIPSHNNSNRSRSPKPRRRNSWPALPSLDKTLNIIFPTPALNKCVEWICGREAKYYFLRQKDLKAWASHPASIANTKQSASSANGATVGVRQGTPSSASALWQEPDFRAKYWARQNETSSRPVTAPTGSTPQFNPNKSHDRAVSGSALVSFPSPEGAQNKKRMDELAALVLPPPPPAPATINSPPTKSCPSNVTEGPTLPPQKSPDLPEACKFKRTPLLPGQEPFVPVPVFSQQWDLPTAVIETNHPNDPRLQAYLRKYKIEAVLRPDFLTISTHARTSSKEQEAMDEFVRRPDCRIDPQYLDPVLAREKRQRMAEQAMISNSKTPLNPNDEFR
jgi:hypothetical protein